MDVKTNPAQSRGKSVQREVVASSVGSESVSKVNSGLDNGFEFTDINDSGTVKVTASASVMSLFPVGVFTYDIQQNVDGAVTTILRGSFKVNEDISG